MKSSDVRQKFEYKRTALYNQGLPVKGNFGTELPYPLMLTNWDDDISGKQFVFSTFNGCDVSHWVAVGVNSLDGSLSAWQPDGNYKRIVMEDFSEPETKVVIETGVMPHNGDTIMVNHGVPSSSILSATLMVEHTTGVWIEPSTSLLSGTDASLRHTGGATEIYLPDSNSWKLDGENFKLTLLVLR